ncbi:unnamed protein product [Linum trigynum]|uniref:Glycosyltransferase 61 catalytic domain-containing protein n=1 Tax=Linum trigynum TaxID=586398 RepID=A0AAV2G4F6_9ROSI
MMMYDSLLARSFTKHEQKKLGRGALIICFLIFLSFCTIFKPQKWGPLPSPLDLRWSPGLFQKLYMVNDTASSLLHMAKKKNVEITPNNIPAMENHTSGSMQHTPNPASVKQSRRTTTTTTKNDVSTMNHREMNTTNNNDGGMEKQSKKQSRIPVTCSKGERSDFCDLNGDVRVDPGSATVYYVGAGGQNKTASTMSIKPYGRKGDEVAMGLVREWSLKMVAQDDKDLPACSQIHESPGVVFSLGGFAGNHFHAFTDVLVPLFATARRFDGEVELLITDHQPWLVAKFGTILRALSRYNSMDLDKEQQSEKTHCFSRLILGLKGRHKKELNINPSESEYTMVDFKQFLRNAYSLEKAAAIKLQSNDKKSRPQLLIISRKRTRAFTNVNDVARMARTLGYQVTVAEPDRNISKSAEIMNSCDVVMGVHGAGLTNMVFVPDNAILVQVVPLGADWISKTYFREPSENMKVRYLEYKIKREESSLIEHYPPDDVVFTKPWSFAKENWDLFKSIYLDNQNVKLDVKRFRPTLLKALELLHQ